MINNLGAVDGECRHLYRRTFRRSVEVRLLPLLLPLLLLVMSKKVSRMKGQIGGLVNECQRRIGGMAFRVFEEGVQEVPGKADRDAEYVLHVGARLEHDHRY